jgi:hypothetical protein
MTTKRATELRRGDRVRGLGTLRSVSRPFDRDAIKVWWGEGAHGFEIPGMLWVEVDE